MLSNILYRKSTKEDISDMKKIPNNSKKGYANILLEQGDMVGGRLCIQDFCYFLFDCMPAWRSRYFIPNNFKVWFGKNYYVWCDYFDGRLVDKNTNKVWKNSILENGNKIEKAYIGYSDCLSYDWDVAWRPENILIFDRVKGGYKFLGVFIEDKTYGNKLETFKGKSYMKISDTFMFPVRKTSYIASELKRYSK